jgi:DNA polymerase-4
MWERSLKQQPQDGRALFVDMNSFFASVEQQTTPALRGIPVGICPFISDTTSVIAASIEAKRYGIKTGTKVTQAKQLYPAIKLVQANPRKYRHYHRQIMAELDNLPCHVHAKSIDEALLLVPSYLREEALTLAHQIKERIANVGDQLKCSVGVASNMFLAKMATNLHKPDGLFEVKTEKLEEFYAPLQLLDLHGISWRMRRRLQQIGIGTPLDFFQAPAGLLRQNFGVNGEAWYLRLRGYEVDLKPTTRRMIGHQMTITPDPAHTRDEVLSVASQLTYRAATRLRAAELAARGVVLGIRFQDRTWWQKVYHGREPFFDSVTFYNHVQRLFKNCRMPKPVRLVSVSAIDLIEQPAMPVPLFQTYRREEQLSQALDDINFRYGENTIVTGNQLRAGKPRDAIGYGNATLNVLELPK